MHFAIDTRYGYDYEDVIKAVESNGSDYFKGQIHDEKIIEEISSYVEKIQKTDSIDSSSDLRTVVVLNYRERKVYVGFDSFRTVKIDSEQYGENKDFFNLVIKQTNCKIRRTAKKVLKNR